MRLKLLLEPLKEKILIPWDYRTNLTQVIYKTLEKASPKYSQWLHDEGFQIKTKKFKLFVYSDLQLWRHQTVKEGLMIFAPITWILSSPDPNFVKLLVEGIRKDERKLKLFGNHFNVIDMLPISTPTFPESFIFHTLSPVVVSTHNPEKSPLPIYLSPDNPDFALGLEKNLLAKWEAYYKKPNPNQKFGIRVWRPERKLVRVFDINVRAWHLKVQLWGSRELIRFAYEVGLGEKNSMGFGMLEAGE